MLLSIYSLTLRHSLLSLAYVLRHSLLSLAYILLSIPSHYDTHSYHWHTAIYSFTLRHSLLSLAYILLSIASLYDTHSVSPLSLLSIHSHYSTHPCHTFLSEQMYTHLYLYIDLAIIMDQKRHAHVVIHARVYSVVIAVYRPHFFTPLLLAF